MTDRGKPKNLKKNLTQCHFVHHKFHMFSLVLTSTLHCVKPAPNCLSYSTAFLLVHNSHMSVEVGPDQKYEQMTLYHILLDH